MGFWGVEVKPGKPEAYSPQNEHGKLHVTQATLGAGSGKEKSVIQCSIGDNDPIYLCSLLPNKAESCPLNLEFEDDDDPVEFSVTGDRSIHLSGFFEAYEQQYEEEDEEDDDSFHYDNISDGIDIGDSGSGESSDYDSEEEEHMDEIENFLDANLDRFRRSSAPNSGVVIEEIEDEETPAKESKAKRPNKKSQAKEDENAKKQIVAKETAPVPVLESEDEDGLPISKEAREPENKTAEKMVLDSGEQVSKKRKAEPSVRGVKLESVSKSQKKKNKREKKKEENLVNEVAAGNVVEKQETSQSSSISKAQTMTESSKTPDTSAEKKAKKKETKPSQVRTHPNGLIVEELHMGKPNAKKADPGKKVSVRYIGKLQKNGKIFDSNIGKKPFQFHLGVGEVIKGWDVGVAGMRVGDKRRLTIPPAMGYGSTGAGGAIPPNAWLMFDVELVDVK